MQPVFDNGNVGGSVHVLKVGADSNLCNLFYVFIREQGQCVTDNHVLYEVLPHIAFMAVFVHIFLPVTFIVEVSRLTIAVGVHF